MADRPPSGPADYLAAERTFLAWIRTGLALMGFGFVVARFGLFLQALQIGQSNLQVKPYGPSFWFGTALIVLGVVVNLVCARNHYRLVQELNRGGTGFNHPSWLAMWVAVILAIVGVAMAIYVVSVREPVENQHREIKETSMIDNGIVNVASGRSVDETVQKFQKILEAKGVKLFALVDHSGEAEKAGLQMRRSWFGKTPRPGFGCRTTVRDICRRGTDCRRSCCRISRWWRSWRRARRTELVDAAPAMVQQNQNSAKRTDPSERFPRNGSPHAGRPQ
jgi:putative membrane protein